MSLKKRSLFKNLTKISLQYGLLASLLMALLTLIFYYVSGSVKTPVIIWNYLVFAITMFTGVKSFQKKINTAAITFKEAYISGVLIGITASVFFSVFMIFYSRFIDIKFITNFITVNTLKTDKNISAEDLKQQINEITPVIIGFYALFQLMLISLFLPLLIFVFFKHSKNSKQLSVNSYQ